MAVLNIVMVEPEIPQNTGMSRAPARQPVRGCTWSAQWALRLTTANSKRAGLDYWHLLDISYYESLAGFFAKNNGDFFYFSTKAPHIHTEVVYPDGCYLVFGKETAGLPERLLYENPERCVRIPMRAAARSLNLSNSVAIGVYEALRQWGYPALQCKGELREFTW